MSRQIVSLPRYCSLLIARFVASTSLVEQRIDFITVLSMFPDSSFWSMHISKLHLPSLCDPMRTLFRSQELDCCRSLHHEPID